MRSRDQFSLSSCSTAAVRMKTGDQFSLSSCNTAARKRVIYLSRLIVFRFNTSPLIAQERENTRRKELLCLLFLFRAVYSGRHCRRAFVSEFPTSRLFGSLYQEIQKKRSVTFGETYRKRGQRENIRQVKFHVPLVWKKKNRKIIGS